MNKRYMDFVPKGTAKKPVARPVAKQPEEEPVVVEPKPVLERPRARIIRASDFAPKKAPKTVQKPKAQPVAKAQPAVKAQPNNLKTVKAEDYRRKFVNLEKVNKRPLSKNVSTKKVEVPKETPSGPVTIIDKPEKDSKVGLIVTIIITIILGAAAGTVAFLLLPK